MHQGLFTLYQDLEGGLKNCWLRLFILSWSGVALGSCGRRLGCDESRTLGCRGVLSSLGGPRGLISGGGVEGSELQI